MLILCGLRPSHPVQVLAVFHPPRGGRLGRGENGGNARAECGGSARSVVLVETIAGVPASMAGMIGRYLGQLHPEAAASVSVVYSI